MTRTVKKPEVRKGEILTTAQRFFFQKGYDKTSVNDIIGELGIAKGTFYHYFASKMDLLNELLDKVTNEMSTVLTPILDTNVSATEKFNMVFKEGTAFKIANVDVFLLFLKVMFKDENTVVRIKMYRRMIQKTTHIYTSIIKQGIKEGLFDTQDPDNAAELLMQLGMNLNETICWLMLREDETAEHLTEIIKQKINTYQYAMERILGAKKGSIKLYASGNFENIIKVYHDRLREKHKTESTDTSTTYRRGY